MNNVIDTRVRLGKTAKDATNNAASTNANNKRARAAWQKESCAGSVGGTPGSFPAYTCNGHRTRALRARPSRA